MTASRRREAHASKMDFLGSGGRERGGFGGGAPYRVPGRPGGGAGDHSYRLRRRLDGGRPLGRDVSTPRERQMPGRASEADPPRQERHGSHSARPIQLG